MLKKGATIWLLFLVVELCLTNMEILYFDKNKKENEKLEFKRAKGGLPKSFFETYSAFLNTKGGLVYIGINELSDKSIVSSMLTMEEIDKIKNELFNNLNNPQKVSVNLLNSNNVKIKEFDGYPVLEIKLEPSPIEYKPVFINNNILTGTYRRNHEGDYKCSPSEIKAMLRDAESKSQDLLCLEELGVEVLCRDTIASYKNRLLALRPEHIFSQGNENQFLEYLGAIRVGKDGNYHPTRAGLLMFGYSYKIVYEFPEYFVDYQEHYSDDINQRWTDRLTSDTGDWSGNLYDFYCKVSRKLTSDLKSPFVVQGTTRVDETEMHKAMREALCNAISNSDFYQAQGLVIKKYRDRIEFYNPGCLRMSVEKMFKGGDSNARNKTILKMFNLVGVGERSGSGFPQIVRACEMFNYDTPSISEVYNPDRTCLTVFSVKQNNTKDDIKPTLNNTKYSGNEKKVITFLSNSEKVKAKDIANAIGLSVSTVKVILYKLVDEKVVSTEGTIKDKKYFINNVN